MRILVCPLCRSRRLTIDPATTDAGGHGALLDFTCGEGHRVRLVIVATNGYVKVQIAAAPTPAMKEIKR